MIFSFWNSTFSSSRSNKWRSTQSRCNHILFNVVINHKFEKHIFEECVNKLCPWPFNKDLLFTPTNPLRYTFVELTHPRNFTYSTLSLDLIHDEKLL